MHVQVAIGSPPPPGSTRAAVQRGSSFGEPPLLVAVSAGEKSVAGIHADEVDPTRPHAQVSAPEDGAARDELLQNAAQTDDNETEEESLADWMARYRIGRAGASDQTPDPPAAIRAILDGRDNVKSPTTSATVTGHGKPGSSGRDSPSTASIDSRASSASLPSVNSLTVATLLDFYRRKGHLPAPPGPYEEERLRLAHKYGLDQPVRRKAIDRICSLAKAYFRTSAVVISLTFDDHQVLGAERGWGGEEPGLDVPPRPLTMEPAFCTHAMLSSYRDPKAVFIVGDADKDWRFKGNPYTIANGGGLAFYAAANVNLPVPSTGRYTASGLELPSTLASGALCLVDPQPRKPSDFSDQDRAVLVDFAEMISREFQLGFAERRRAQEAQQSDFVDSFLRQALVLPNGPDSFEPIASRSVPSTRASSWSGRRDDDPVKGPDSAPSVNCRNEELSTANATRESASTTPAEPRTTIFHTAAHNLRTLTFAGSAALLDLRSYRSSTARSPVQHPHDRTSGQRFLNPESPATSVQPAPGNGNRATPLPDPAMPSGSSSSLWRTAGTGDAPPVGGTGGAGTQGKGRISLMAADGDVDWFGAFTSKSEGSWRDVMLGEAVDDVLKACFDEGIESPEASHVDASPFVAHGLIPDSLATASICIPVFDVDGQPILLVILASGEKWFDFEPNDRRFAGSVGAIIVGSLLRQRAIEADLAKLRFVSHVSHELRTPLHGCNSQIELIREFASPAELRKLAPLLDAADVCLESLSDVLNDTLDFSKLTQPTSSSEEELAEYRRRAFVQTDLCSLIEGVVKSTWVRKQRVDSVSTDLSKPHLRSGLATTDAADGQVDLVLEIEERKGGWSGFADVGGLKRVLLNLVGNALKFTHRGEIKISLREVGVLANVPAEANQGVETERRIVAITVRDTGIGMSEDFIRNSSYLTPFLQADPFVSGAGLGLSIVHTILKRMGGKLDVVSQLGAGTSMSITLPIDLVASAPSTSTLSPSLPRISRRNVSEELARLLHLGPGGLGPLTPPAQPARNISPSAGFFASQPRVTTSLDKVDFETAISVAHASLSPTIQPVRPDSLARTPSFQLNTPPRKAARTLGLKADSNELVVETAKLSVAAVSSAASRRVPMSDPLDADRPLSIVPPVSDAVTGPSHHGKVRVLVAEDNPIARNILVKLLTGKGIPFSAAEDGQEALELFEAGGGSYSLFLADVQMPRLDGIDASIAMRRLEAERGWPPMRILALTGLSNESDMQKALGSDGPINEWIVKGGRSLRIILDEVKRLQSELDEANGVVLA
ncbi:hybrid sensor histidine kinase/response regulator [Rhodotorula paludigena]|uniref:hybrid sensor histidine kinase/response regulator n=1 Tax=Rhodotorula paludigena TaxID=86838 RepID=UPI00317971B7